MLHLGVSSMLVRYPFVVATAYAMFLACVVLWVKYADSAMRYEVPPEEDPGPAPKLRSRNSSPADAGFDLPSLGRGGSSGGGSPGGGVLGRGGGFDGGGASASWAESGPRMPVMPNNAMAAQSLASSAGDAPAADTPSIASSSGGSSGSASSKGGFEFDLGDGDGLLIALAIALVVAVLAASGYLVFAAPDILSEAAFGAVLAGGLARRSKNEDAMGWMSGVVRRTWWPFAIVLVLALVFAGYVHANFPQARTFGEAVHAGLMGEVPQ